MPTLPRRGRKFRRSAARAQCAERVTASRRKKRCQPRPVRLRVPMVRTPRTQPVAAASSSARLVQNVHAATGSVALTSRHQPNGPMPWAARLAMLPGSMNANGESGRMASGHPRRRSDEQPGYEPQRNQYQRGASVAPRLRAVWMSDSHASANTA